jgi:hypothetical protein
MTARTHEAVRVGLRSVIRDPRAGVSVRMRAIELLLQVEGLMETPKPNGKRVSMTTSEAKTPNLRDLLAPEPEKESRSGLPALHEVPEYPET